MELYWLHADDDAKKKIEVYAVIRSKLLYGLPSVALNDSLRKKLDIFQRKGLRQILKTKTTFVTRSNTNAYIIKVANETVKNTIRKPKLYIHYRKCMTT